MTRHLTHDEKRLLLEIARNAIKRALEGERRQRLDLEELPPHLKELGACFVTLTKKGVLRGCVGSIEASQPLILDVRDRALAAAFEDPRFPPLSASELSELDLEISILTPPEILQYHHPAELPELLRPGVDGVILTYQFRRATFLPQVWDKLPEPEEFLGRLCQKMGMESEAWKHHLMEVETYQVEMFSEDEVLN